MNKFVHHLPLNQCRRPGLPPIQPPLSSPGRHPKVPTVQIVLLCMWKKDAMPTAAADCPLVYVAHLATFRCQSSIAPVVYFDCVSCRKFLCWDLHRSLPCQCSPSLTSITDRILSIFDTSHHPFPRHSVRLIVSDRPRSRIILTERLHEQTHISPPRYIAMRPHTKSAISPVREICPRRF